MFAGFEVGEEIVLVRRELEGAAVEGHGAGAAALALDRSCDDAEQAERALEDLVEAGFGW